MIDINKIYNEHCLETLTRLENGCIDLLFQDPPFGTTKNGWDVKPDLKTLWPEWLRVGKKNCAFVFFAQQPFASELINSMPLFFRYEIIWQKTLPVGFLNANRMPLRSHENILVFYRSLPTYNPQKTTGHQRKVATAKHKLNCKATTNYGEHGLTTYDSTERYPTSVMTYAKDPNSKHPTKKPLPLVRALVKTYSNEGDIVFDGYAGEGTTAAACIIENRNFICSEKEKVWYMECLKTIEQTR